MASEGLKQVLKLITPPPLIVPENYEGVEYRWKMLVFRPGLFQKEAMFVAAVLFYLAWYFVGKNYNISRAHKWFNAHLPLYETQFTKPVQRGGLTRDGCTDFYAFSTGRRALASLHTTLVLRPYHDFFQLTYQIVRGVVEVTYRVEDEVELDFTFQEGANVPDCVWAIVAKDELRDIKDRRWDLSFARVTEHSSLPPSLSVMSEFADVTDCLMKQHGPLSLSKVLSDPAVLPYFRSLSLTDQPRTRPVAPLPASQRKKRLILALRLPPAADAHATLPLIAAAFQLCDVVAGAGGWGIGRGPGARGAGAGLAASLRPDTRTKLRAARERVEKDIREEAIREKREEEEAERAAAKKKAEEERLAKLSAADQRKELEKEKKRMLRKTQGKIAKR